MKNFFFLQNYKYKKLDGKKVETFNPHIGFFHKGIEKFFFFNVYIIYILVIILTLGSEFEYYLNKFESNTIKYWGYEKAVIFLGHLNFISDEKNDSFWLYDNILKQTREFSFNEKNLDLNLNLQYQKYIFSQMPIYFELINYINLSFSSKLININELEFLKHRIAQIIIVQLIKTQIKYNCFELSNFKTIVIDYISKSDFELKLFISEILENINFDNLFNHMIEKSIWVLYGYNFSFKNEFNIDYYNNISYNIVQLKKKNEKEKKIKLKYDTILKKINFLSKMEFKIPDNEISVKDSKMLKSIALDFNIFDKKKTIEFDTLEAKEFYDQMVQNQVIINDWVFHSLLCARFGYFYYNIDLKEKYVEINNIYKL